MAEDTKNENTEEQKADDTTQEQETSTTEEKAPEESAEVLELKRQLEKAEKAKLAAEKSLDFNKSEMAKMKGAQREQLSKDEQLAEREKEIAEREADVQRRMNRAVARETLSPLNLTDKDMTAEELDYFVTPDEAETIARCKYIVSLLTAREKSLEKEFKEKYLKVKEPSQGDKPDTPDIWDNLENKYKNKKE